MGREARNEIDMIRLRVVDSKQMSSGDCCLVLRQMVDPATGRCIDVAVIIEYKDKHFEPWTEAKVITQKFNVVPNDKPNPQEPDPQGSTQGEAVGVCERTPEEGGPSQL